jgi:hypothetical protein
MRDTFFLGTAMIVVLDSTRKRAAA